MKEVAETQQEKCCASGAKQYWHPSRLITLSFFTFLRLLVRTRETSSSVPDSSSRLWDQTLSSSSGSLRLTHSSRRERVGFRQTSQFGSRS